MRKFFETLSIIRKKNSETSLKNSKIDKNNTKKFHRLLNEAIKTDNNASPLCIYRSTPLLKGPSYHKLI